MIMLQAQCCLCTLKYGADTGNLQIGSYRASMTGLVLHLHIRTVAALHVDDWVADEIC